MRDHWLKCFALIVAALSYADVSAQDLSRQLPPTFVPQYLPTGTVPPPNLLPDPTASAPANRPTTLPDQSPAPPSQAQIALSFEYHLMKVRHGADGFALADPNTDAIPDGRLESINGQVHSAFRYGIGYRAGGSPWEFAFYYMYYRSTDSRSIVALPGGELFPTLTRPGTIDTADMATGTFGVRYNLYDVELARKVMLESNFGLRVFGGVRFANINQTLAGFYDGRAADHALVNGMVDFNGTGLTVGAEAHWALIWGISLFGKARGGMLFGNANMHLRQTNNSGATVEADVTDGFSQTVPILELGLGIGWQFRHMWARVGYDATAWFNLADAPTFGDGTSPGRISRRESNLTFDGFFAQLGIAF